MPGLNFNDINLSGYDSHHGFTSQQLLNAENELLFHNDSLVSFQNSKLDNSKSKIDVYQMSFSTNNDMMSVVTPSTSIKQLNLPTRMGSNKQEVLQAILFVVMAASGGKLPETLKTQKRDI